MGSERSLTYRLIKKCYGDAHAVEMEGYGALAAAHVPNIDAVVIRTISDNVDKTDCDDQGWQPAAAHVASAFAFEV